MLTRALALAQHAATLGEVPIGAVIYDPATGQVIAEAANRRELDADPTAHAEVLAIRAAGRALGDWRLEHLAIAITLEPCAMCAGAIVSSRLARVVFGAMDPKAGACGSLMRLTEDPRLNHRVTPIRLDGPIAEACGEALKAFFAQKRRTTPITNPS